MTAESDTDVASGNGHDEAAPLVPRKRARKVQTSPSGPALKAMARKAAKNKPAKAPAKAKGAAKAKPAKGAKARKPRTADPAKLDQFGLRKGSIKSQAAAMYAKGKGATLNDVKEALESTQFNVLTELEGKGFKITRTKVPGIGARQATKYHLSARNDR
jgi:hypothetical protein